MTCTSSVSLHLYTTAICQSQRESGWARLTVNPSLPGGLRGRPVWLSVTQSWAQCGKPATTKWPTWAKWLHMCQWWAAVHKFELEVTSNLKISTLNLKLGSSDCNKSMRWIKAVAVQLNNSPHWPPSTLAMARPEEVEHLEAGAPNGPVTPAAPSRRAGAMI